MKRLLSVLLLLALLCPLFAACDKTPDDPAAPGTSGPADTDPAETLDPNDRRNAKDSLPADFNMNGETVGVLTRNTYRKIDWDGAGADEVLAQAVYNRTEAVQERLGLTFDVTDMELGYDDYGNAIKENIMAGDDTWQIILAAGNASIRMGNDHLFLDMSDNPYLDFEREWWAGDLMENISIDGKTIRFMVGDATMNTYYWTYVTFFNKRIYEDAFGDPDELYKKAIGNDWFYDDMMEMSEKAHNDVNGDGKMDEGDTFGMFLDNQWSVSYMEAASGLKTFHRDENGYPVLSHDTDRGMEILEKLYTLVYETPGVDANLNLWGGGERFNEGFVLFHLTGLNHTDGEEFRNMEDDYGILPIPRVDEKQESYLSPITNSSTFITVPKTCTDDRIGGVIEALSSESYRSVVEVFYESALKMKYSRDAYSGQCIDIIKNCLFKSFFTEYYSRIGGSYFLTDAMVEQTKNYVSRYTAMESAINKKIVDMIVAINEASE